MIREGIRVHALKWFRMDPVVSFYAHDDEPSGSIKQCISLLVQDLYKLLKKVLVP
jgi:hypothetical protein